MATVKEHKVIAVVLAAGRSTRMGEINKLLEPWQGQPLVTHVVEAALGCDGICDIVVVTGHQAERIETGVTDGVEFVHNPHYASGMASSLKTAIEWAGAREPDGVLVMLGDMPLVNSAHIGQMLAAFAEAGRRAIVQATNRGEPGNPVLLPTDLFDELLQIDGDRGARAIIAAHADRVISVEIGTAAARDFDTPEAFAELKG